MLEATANVLFLAIMLFSALSFVCFAYFLSREDKRLGLQNPIRIASGIVTVITFAVPLALTISATLNICKVEENREASGWIMILTALLCQAIIFGCMREDIKDEEYSVQLSLVVYGVSCISLCYSITYINAFGSQFAPAYYCANVGLNTCGIVSILQLWKYVLFIGRLDSRPYAVATVVLNILAALGCLAFFTSPLTDFAVALNPDRPGTVQGAGYPLAASPLVIAGLFIVVAAARAKIGKEERIALFTLILLVPLSQLIYQIDGHVYVTTALFSIGALGCYLGIVVRRANLVEQHLAQVDIAYQIQQDMLPQSFPDDPRFAVYGRMWPAKEVAGDFYDFYQPDDNHVYITVADVSGKDVPAAIFMSKAHALIREYEKEGLEPHEIFAHVNRALVEGNSEAFFVTAWMGKTNLEKGIITYANAGHNPPAILRPGVGQYFLTNEPNSFLGARKRAKYQRYSALLKRGDQILLYTDGITESVNTRKEQYGENRLLSFVASNAGRGVQEIAEGLYDEVNRFAEGMEQFDDMTVLCGTFLGDPLTTAKDYAEEVFLASLDQLDDVMEFLAKAGSRMGYPQDHALKLNTCIDEIFVNIASYAYAGSREQGKVRVSVTLLDGEIDILFADTGIPFDPLAKEEPDFEKRAQEKTLGGLGIYMVRKFMDDVRYECIEGENRLTIVKYLDAEHTDEGQ